MHAALPTTAPRDGRRARRACARRPARVGSDGPRARARPTDMAPGGAANMSRPRPAKRSARRGGARGRHACRRSRSRGRGRAGPLPRAGTCAGSRHDVVRDRDARDRGGVVVVGVADGADVRQRQRACWYLLMRSLRTATGGGGPGPKRSGISECQDSLLASRPAKRLRCGKHETVPRVRVCASSLNE